MFDLRVISEREQSNALISDCLERIAGSSQTLAVSAALCVCIRVCVRACMHVRVCACAWPEDAARADDLRWDLRVSACVFQWLLPCEK